jgi:hypothetical protein
MKEVRKNEKKAYDTETLSLKLTMNQLNINASAR